MSNLIEARTYLLAHNWSVFPLGSYGEWLKRPNEEALRLQGYKREDGHGTWLPLQHKLPTEDDLQHWFGISGNNIALVTGTISGVVVLDIDGQEGFNSIGELDVKLPKTPTVKTSNGMHVYFRHPGFPVSNFQNKLPGIDFRGDGGYVVLPPSVHPSGKSYEWETDPFDVDFAPVPEWLMTLLTVQEPEKEPASQLTDNDPIPNGNRNSRLTSIAGGLRRRGFNTVELTATLRAINQNRCSPPLPDKEVEIIAKSVGRYEPKEKLINSVDYNLTELGNSERIIDKYGQDIRYIVENKRWRLWDGSRWGKATPSVLTTMVASMARELGQEAAKIEDNDKRLKVLKWALANESNNRIVQTINLVGKDPRIELTVNQLDHDLELLNVLNGVVNLRTGEVRDARREDYCTKQAPVVYHEGAKAPVWEKFLMRIFDGDLALIDYVQRAVGYTLTGEVMEKCLFFLYGGGDNGKSTFVETIMALMGDYAVKGRSNMILGRGADAPPYDLATLAGRRMTVLSEVAEGTMMAEETLKDLTGGDTITAREPYGGFFSFTPTHKIWLYGNHKPIIRGRDAAIWNRIHLIPFTVTIPKAEQDMRLKDKLQEEASGILNWAIEGLLKWRKCGLSKPVKVEQSTNNYQGEMDVLSSFFSECCELGNVKDAVRTADLYRAYSAWCMRSGMSSMSSPQFVRTVMSEAGGTLDRLTDGKMQKLERFRKSDANYYRGIKLK